MALLVYDGSFVGLLSAIFHSFAVKRSPSDIVKQEVYQASLLEPVEIIVADDDQAERVLKGIDARSDNAGSAIVYKMFLSELPGIELRIFKLVCLLVEKNTPGVLNNFANEQVSYSKRVVTMINREVHRMHALVRFQKLANGIYYAVIHPDFDVLPLIGEHFLRRYADQPWMIYDASRQYGLAYDLQKMQYVDTDFALDCKSSTLPENSAKEDVYQQLWKQYFQSVNIKERENRKLHLRHLPKRYWKYLIEKQV